MSESNEIAVSPRRPRRQRLHGVILGTIILLCGIVIGSVATFHVAMRGGMPPFPPPGVTPERITQRLQKDLGLTEDQVPKVRAIIERDFAELTAIRAKYEPEMEAHMESVRGQVETLLTPDQAKRWNEHVAKMRERFHSHAPEKKNP